MANPNFKGRQKGSTKKTSTISDPLLGDYKIIFDEESYNLILNDPKTSTEKVVGYYTNLEYLLKRVTKNQMAEKDKTYTIKEYITEFETILNNFKNLIND